MSFFIFSSFVAICVLCHTLRHFFNLSVAADGSQFDNLFWMLCFAAPALLIPYMQLSPLRNIWYRCAQFGLGLVFATLLYAAFIPLEPADSTLIEIARAIVSIDNWFASACFLLGAFFAWRERPAYERRLAHLNDARTDEWGLPIID